MNKPAAQPMDDDSKKEAADRAFLESTKSKVIACPKKHHASFPVKDIVFDPSENYRWGSKEGMERDIKVLDTSADGSASTFQVLKDSIQIQGVRDAVELVQRSDGCHIVSGFTRIKIATDLGLKTIPAYIYESSLSDAELEFLQLQENAREMHRDVNWVQEITMWRDLCARYSVSLGVTLKEAGATVQKVMGKSWQTMKNREHWFNCAKGLPRIQKLAQEGVISCSCLQSFLTSDKAEPYSPAFVDEVLDYISKGGDLPSVIDPAVARLAIRNVKIRTANAVFGEDGERKSKNTGKTSAKIRQSVPVLRDLATAMACCHLTNEKLTLDSSEAEIEELTESFEWAMYVGIGLGAGEIHVPPVLEQVLGDRADDDAFVLSQDQQHRRTSDIYARSIFIRAFLMLALKSKGVRDIGMVSSGGWLAKSSIVAKERRDHRDVFYRAVKDAAELHDEKKKISLKTRALQAWAALKGTY